MTWNYRIILHDDHAEPWYGLHEVHYRDGKISGFTTPIEFTCNGYEGPEGIVRSLRMALRDAQERPVLKLSEIPLPEVEQR